MQKTDKINATPSSFKFAMAFEESTLTCFCETGVSEFESSSLRLKGGIFWIFWSSSFVISRRWEGTVRNNAREEIFGHVRAKDIDKIREHI